MLDAVVGALIMVMATSSMLYSIQVAERAFNQAGQYPLSLDEKETLRSVGILNEAEAEAFFLGNIKNSPREVGLDR